jgi:tetratricopeptide (TPR) repeat protein
MRLRTGAGLVRALTAGVALAALAGCAAGPSGTAGGCRTIYVFMPGQGVVQPTRSCGGLPREDLRSALASAAGGVSAAAAETAAPAPPEGGYEGPTAMIEAGDMAAFMARVRADYAADQNAEAWGYAAIDALAAGDVDLARRILDAMEAKGAEPQFLGAAQLKPWVAAAGGDAAGAQAAMQALDGALPEPTLRGHKALLAEALGRPEDALALYAEATETLQPPDEANAGTPAFFTQFMMFQRQRGLALRQADLLRALRRDAEAVALLTRLSEASDSDGYVEEQLARARSARYRREVLGVREAMSLAIGDQAALIEERQDLMAAMTGRGDKPPFNPLLSSMRQAALLLDPGNAQVRLAEVNELYSYGHFPAALRLAQLGDATPTDKAALLSTAGFAALELGSEETLQALVRQGLSLQPGADARLAAASALVNADDVEGATRLADQVLAGSPTPSQRVSAILTKAQARMQAGDAEGAVRFAREAVELRDDEGNRQFLASMLIRSPDRAEGLQILRGMLADSPRDTGLMNNLGYALVDGHRTPAELDEGFQLLKEASRITPDEPNLLDSLGWAYYHYGDYAEARRFVELALDNYLPFHNWELEDHMGDILWRQGEEAEARKRWEMAVKARPPANDRARIEAKVRSGLTTPAPVQRTPPDVPLTRERSRGSSEI